jgi:hypothetical protein
MKKLLLIMLTFCSIGLFGSNFDTTALKSDIETARQALEDQQNSEARQAVADKITQAQKTSEDQDQATLDLFNLLQEKTKEQKSKNNQLEEEAAKQQAVSEEIEKEDLLRIESNQKLGQYTIYAAGSYALYSLGSYLLPKLGTAIKRTTTRMLLQNLSGIVYK